MLNSQPSSHGGGSQLRHHIAYYTTMTHTILHITDDTSLGVTGWYRCVTEGFLVILQYFLGNFFLIFIKFISIFPLLFCYIAFHFSGYFCLLSLPLHILASCLLSLSLALAFAPAIALWGKSPQISYNLYTLVCLVFKFLEIGIYLVCACFIYLC